MDVTILQVHIAWGRIQCAQFRRLAAVPYAFKRLWDQEQTSIATNAYNPS